MKLKDFEYYRTDNGILLIGDNAEILPLLEKESVDCIVTSPPYWGLRDYGVAGQLGLEKTPKEYIANLCCVFDEIKRILKPTGTCWVNLGDTYGGSMSGEIEDNKAAQKGTGATSLKHDRPSAKMPAKSMCQLPSRFAIKMADDGWILRNEIIWHKKNVMPSSVKDRFTVDFEKIFFFVKSKKYYFEQQLESVSNKSEMDYRRALRRKNAHLYNCKTPYQGNFPKKFREDGKRNKRCVWNIPTRPYKAAHFAAFPETLIETPIKAGCPEGGVVLDPFFGSGTTAVACEKLGRKWVGVEINEAYYKIAKERIEAEHNQLKMF